MTRRTLTSFAWLPGLVLGLVLAAASSIAAAQDSDAGATPSVKLLIVDGAPHAQPSRCETFYFRTAITAHNDAIRERPDVDRDAVLFDIESCSAENLATATFDGVRAVLLANVTRPAARTFTLLQWFVARGGTLIITLGDRIDAAHYNQLLAIRGSMLPLRLDDTLGTGSDMPVSETPGANLLHELDKPTVGKLVRVRRNDNGGAAAGSDVEGTRLRVANGGSLWPLLVVRRYGRGAVVLFTSSLDGDWNPMVAQPIYPLLWTGLLGELAGKPVAAVRVPQRADGRLKMLEAQLQAVEVEGGAMLERARQLREAGMTEEADRLGLLVEALESRHRTLLADVRDVELETRTRHWLPRELRMKIDAAELKLDTDDTLTAAQHKSTTDELQEARQDARSIRLRIELENGEWRRSIARMEQLAAEYTALDKRIRGMQAGADRTREANRHMLMGVELTTRFDAWKAGVERRTEQWNELIRRASDAGDNAAAAALRNELNALDDQKMKLMVGPVMEAAMAAETANLMSEISRSQLDVRIAMLEERVAAAREANDAATIMRLEAELRELQQQRARMPGGR
ncbi:MAG: hypothetical protein AB7S36_00560 [Planctomycetota bacterium]